MRARFVKEDEVGTSMTTSMTTPYDPWGRSVLNALRRWIFLPIILALVGTGIGLFAGTRGTPSAQAMIRVESSSTDGTAMQIIEQSTVLEVDTTATYQAAAQAAGTTAADLRRRTQIGAVPDSQLISITVSAPTSDDAVKQANAIANTAIKTNDDQIESEVDSVTESTRKLLSGSKLKDSRAEQARVSRLGDMLGQNQSNLVVGSRSLTLVQAAEVSSLLPSKKLLAGLGLLAGLLLGGAIALLLGARRGRIQSAQELHQLYPNAAVVDGLDLESVIALEGENASTVYVAGIHHSDVELKRIAASIRAQFDAFGRQPVPERQRGVGTDDDSRDLQIVTTTLSDTVLRRVARDTEALLIIPVCPKITKMQQLDPFAARLNDRSYLLVDQIAEVWS